jgi:hypothetical protein
MSARQVQLGEHSLSRSTAVDHGPSVRERGHEEHPSAVLRIDRGREELFPARWAPRAGRVGDFDPKNVRGERDPKLEISAFDMPVGHGVRGEFGNDQAGRIGELAAVRDVPFVQLVHGEVAGKSSTTRSGAEAVTEHSVDGRDLAGLRRFHTLTVTRPGSRFPGCGLVRIVIVRVLCVDSTGSRP